MEETEEIEEIEEMIKAKDILKKLAQLIEKQSINAKLRTAISVRESKNNILNKVNTLRNKLIDSGKKFGLSAEQVKKEYLEVKDQQKNILQIYKEALSQCEQSYRDILNEVEEKIEKKELDEQALNIQLNNLCRERDNKKREISYKKWVSEVDQLTKNIGENVKSGSTEVDETLINQLNNLKKRNPLVEYESKIEQLKDQINKVQKELTNAETDYANIQQKRNEDIDNLLLDKNRDMGLLPKQSLIKRVLGAFFNKINGAKKFNDSVIKSIKESIIKAKNDAKSFGDKTRRKTSYIIEQGKAKKQDLLKATSDKLDEALKKVDNKNQELKDRNSESR